MRNLVRWAIISAALVPQLCFGQGSAAGYGQAAGPMGGGGGMGSRGGDGEFPESKAADKQRAIDAYSFFWPDQSRAWILRSAILTPGDKVETKFECKKGDTIVARASSDAFDPALELVDPTGKVVAKNDDLIEGDQSPFLLSKCEVEGVYRLNVVSFRSVAGGKFELRARHFVPADISPGAFESPYANVQTQSGRIGFLRFSAKRGGIYAPTQLVGLENRRAMEPLQVLAILGPTGDFASDMELMGTIASGSIIRAKQDGDYYIMTRNYGEFKSVKGQLNSVPVIMGSFATSNLVKLGSFEHAIVEVPVEPGTAIESSRKPIDGVQFLLDAPEAEKPDGRQFGGDQDPMRTVGSNVTQFQLARRDPSRLMHAFRHKGKANYIYFNHQQKPQELSLSIDNSPELWKSGSAQSERLGIGESKFFLIESKRSEIMRVKLSAEGFMPRLDIYSMQGDHLNSLFNPMLDVATDDLYFEHEGKFLVRVSCDGFGGSGRFELRRDSFATTPYALSSSTSINLDGSNFGLFEVKLEAGKRYELLVDSPSTSARVDLIDHQGAFLRSAQLHFDGVDVHYFVPAVTGSHRLWIRGAPGNLKFQMKLHGRPVIGEPPKP